MHASLWQLLFGLGIFLYGMSRLETGLRDISGERLRQWLMQFTSSPLSSAGAGVVVTLILQSSSMVSLLVLAFASAGLIPLYNGVGVLLGANVGTTATGWLVTILGFKLDLESLAIPLFGLGCLSQVVLRQASRARALGMIVMGLGVLLYGLSLMKSSVAALPQTWDMAALRGQPAILYLLTGMLLTAVIQSSSATMMLTLTALHADLISLPAAAAVVIGADIGTTSTTVLGSLTGSAIKKRLALAHLVFNLTVDAVTFVLLLPLLPRLLALLNIEDPLYSLVAFHTCFNLLGLLFFLPFLKPYTRWISRWFGQADRERSAIESMPTEVPDAALSAMKGWVKALWLQALGNNLKHFNLVFAELDSGHELTDELPKLGNGSWHYFYELIKDREDELMGFALRLQQQPLDARQAGQLGRLLEVTRALVYASKTLKDIHQNLAGLRASGNADSLALFQTQQTFHRDFYGRLLRLMLDKHAPDYRQEELENLAELNDEHHRAMDARVYAGAEGHMAPGAGDLTMPADDNTQLSTQLNVNREIHHANKSLLRSLSLWMSQDKLESDSD